ncbi:NfeD family protein [Sphingobium aquiterrae]|uniref:NfeD family protein n=1 Tax=Sphingobium aquiterrae TaxID=2038656 RepID=UPI00301B255A
MDWIDALHLEDHWWWLIFAVLLGIGEIVIPGVFLIWIAIAAAITGVATLLTGLPLFAQFILFAALCLVAAWAGRRWYTANPVASADPLLNDRAARLIGDTVLVVEAIEGGEGRVKVGDSVWTARGPDTKAGKRVRIIGVQGAVLNVEHVQG